MQLQKAAYDYEHSELLLYQNMVIQESGDSNAALEHLDKYEAQICDKLSLQETRGLNFIKCGKLNEAEKIYTELLQRNPENHLYYHQLAVATKATSVEAKLALYKELGEKYPKAQSPQRLSLDIAQGETFKGLLDAYMKKALRKGIPPLFVDLRPLYKDEAKVKIIQELCQGYHDNLKGQRSFDTDGKSEPATALLWLLYYLAQHHDHLQDHQKAIETLEEAMTHTPTLIELYMLKGNHSTLFKAFASFFYNFGLIYQLDLHFDLSVKSKQMTSAKYNSELTEQFITFQMFQARSTNTWEALKRLSNV